jgi:hypothetical protein
MRDAEQRAFANGAAVRLFATLEAREKGAHAGGQFPEARAGLAGAFGDIFEGVAPVDIGRWCFVHGERRMDGKWDVWGCVARPVQAGERCSCSTYFESRAHSSFDDSQNERPS